jgi:hypothetical protein
MNHRKRWRVRVAPPLWPISVVVIASYLALYIAVFLHTRIASSKEVTAHLQKEFAGVNRVLFRTGPFYKDNADGKGTLRVIEDPKDIAELFGGIEVSASGMECLCGGQFTMELFRNGQLRNRISFHHGVHLRVERTTFGNFPGGDLFLTSASILHIYRWFGRHDIRHPDEYPRQDLAKSAAFAQMVVGHETLFPQGLWSAVFRLYTDDNWKQEIEGLLPDQTERAATLLRLLGTYSLSWNICRFGPLERLVGGILPSLSPPTILAAMERPANDPLLDAGAAHWFFGYGKPQGIAPEAAARLLDRLAPSALVHPRPRNRFLTRRTLARLGSPQARHLLRAFADGKLSLPPPLTWYESELELCPPDARHPVEADESLPERDHALKLLR